MSERPAPFTPDSVIENAIHKTLWTQVEVPLAALGRRALVGDHIGRRALENTLIVSTEKRCYDACAWALGDVAGQSGSADLFDRYFLLSAWFTIPSHDTPLLEHAYFFVREKESGRWHAGSPANWTDTPSPRAFRHLSGSLNQVVDRLEYYSDPAWCRWPPAEEVAVYADQSEGIIPQFTPHEQFPNAGLIRVYAVRVTDARPRGFVETFGIDFGKPPQYYL